MVRRRVTFNVRQIEMQTPRRIQFMGYTWSIDEYDDQLAARAYVAKYFYYRLSPLERRILIEAGPITSTTRHWKAQKVYAFMEERDGHVDDEEVVAIYNGDRRRYIEQAFDRLVAKYGDEINRCLRCNRILRTWSAARCPWCKASWTWEDVPVKRRNPRPRLDVRGIPTEH